ncbi:DUF4442 domain-containing protein [Candidatus Arcticimaribacter]|nr:DUF4442 domain-containing protein [Candidatus Arcticimaribacter sp.]MDA9638603.1 DUF4442 domain-containing protein [Candidatus Arcticimaribacter sp.]
MFRYTLFTFFKLPSVFWTGIRVTKIDLDSCEVSVKQRWINQNPFKSMFWAVQGMAAEFTTGTLIMNTIRDSNRKVSMLVLNNKANFSKKATGRITFSCTQGAELTKLMNELIETGTPKTIWMESIGINEAGDIVSRFNFEWTLKIKK